METENQNTLFEAPEAVTQPMIKIIAVGNAGDAMLSAIATPEFAGAEFACINTDAAAVAASRATVKIHLENKLFRGLGSGGDPDRSGSMAEEQFSTLKSACEGARVVFILAGLGGGAGSGISPVLARAAREAGALVLAFITLPFECEGNRREGQAQAALEKLKSAADGVVCLPNQKIFTLIDENSTLIETFRVTADLLVEGVRGVWSLLTRPGMIQVHFGDLSALIRDRHAENAFAFVEASGPGRAREVSEKILRHPLLDEGRVLAESDAVLVSLTAGQDLTMAEVSRVMEQVKRQCRHAQIIMGAAVDAGMSGKLCVTIIAAKQAPQPVRQVTPRAELVGVTSPAGVSQGPLPVPGVRPKPRRVGVAKAVQGQLPLTIISKGRFDKSEPTLHRGEDLDVPTFIRRGVAMN